VTIGFSRWTSLHGVCKYVLTSFEQQNTAIRYSHYTNPLWYEVERNGEKGTVIKREKTFIDHAFTNFPSTESKRI